MAGPPEPSEPTAHPPAAPSSRLYLLASPRVLLGIMIAAFTAVSFYAGVVSFFDLQTRNAIDLTIFMQALTSTVHGHPYPLYESYDCMTKSRCSFLLVHPSPVLYLAVPLYAAAPSPFTLFAIQSVGVGLAAVPLYLLTRHVTGSPGKGLVAAALFLVWAPTLSGEAFSFHLEAFLPLALFTVAMLWAMGRYRLGLAAAVVAFLVLEIAPVFVFFIGAIVLTYSLERIFVATETGWRRRRAREPGPGPLGAFLAAFRSELTRRDVRYTLVLMAASAVAFVFLFLFLNVWGAGILGVPAPPLAPGLAGVFYDNSSPGAQSLGTILGGSQILHTTEFWLILYGLVAFIPLLAPRTWLVALPWIGWTVLTDTSRYVHLGSQYTMVAAVPLFIGVAYGMRRVPIPAPTPATVPGPNEEGPATPNPPARWRRPRAYRAAWISALVAVVALNAVLMPVDPLLQDAGVNLTEPFQSGYQNHTLELLPGFTWADQLAAQVPHAATVTAPPQVFSLVANDPHAIVLLTDKAESEWSSLPFNVTGGPDDVLLYPGYVHNLSRNFTSNLSEPSLYGLDGWVGSTTVGPLFLYARGHTGPATLYGPAPTPSPVTWSPEGGGLVPGPVGTAETNASAPYGSTISTSPDPNRTALWWSSPGTFLVAGTYTIQLVVAADGPGVTPSDHRPLLTVLTQGLAVSSANWTFGPSNFTAGGWTTLTFHLSLAYPVPSLALEGVVHADGIGMAIAAVTVRTAGAV
ncbi:MAG: DUF2079 domain-containing protein [Thermoplasmata archaeon]|nr:DUF2079 domain-containing protein [Thermoplasmata archaeon]